MGLARILRILIAVGITALLLYIFRDPPAGSRGSDSDASGLSGSASEPAPRRGGQILGTMRSWPRSFNRIVANDQTTDVVSMLLHGRLVRVNRATFEVEPWLAERWESSPDGLTHTFHLRPNLNWSDGAPFSSADVLFSLQATLDAKVGSPLAGNMTVGGQPIRAAVPDANTVVFTFAQPAGPGASLLDMLPIVPKHKLGAALASGKLAEAWGPATPPEEIVGMGPFVLREVTSGQRLVLERNPRYWRTAADGERLPYLDRIVLEMVPEQNAELLRLTSGAADLTHSELRPEDYVEARRMEEAGTIRLREVGVGADADAFWFCLKPEAKAKDPRFAFLQKREFRQALSHAVDREELAQTVFLGEAVPIWGPITPGNERWFSPNLPRYPHDVARARALLKSIGLEDRNNNGIVEDAAGTEARFTVLTQRGMSYYEKGLAVLRDYAKQAGIELEVVPLEARAVFERLEKCNYDAIYMRALMSGLDPAGNLDYWLSSGGTHLWNMNQKTPATEWEKQIDALMMEQARTLDPERRKALFIDAQRIFAENLPVLYFAAPRLFYGYSARLAGVAPSILRPAILWNADSLHVRDPESAASR